MAKKKKRSAAPPPPPPRPSARSSTKSQKEQRRQEAAARKREAAYAAERKALVRRTVVAGLVLALALGAITAYLVVRDQRADELEQALTGSGACQADEKADEGGVGAHVPTPRYSVDPPAGGAHTAQAARSGVYTAAGTPGDGQLVHSLEHGYVIYWHKAKEPPAELERIAEERKGDVIVQERPSLEVPVAATAWGQRLLCSRVDAEALDRFAEAYVGKGPEDVPRG